MRKLAIMALFSLPLFAGFFPQTIHTSVSKVTGNTLLLNSSFPVNGMSGIVVHNYGNNSEAITSRVIQKSAGKVSLFRGDIVHHDELPTIKTAIHAGDKVTGGYLYHNVLLLAPNAEVYARVSSQHDKNWIHPDLFSLFLSKEGDTVANKKNLAAFAKAYQVGLVYIIGNGTAKLFDPISGKIIAQKSMSNLPAKGESPFFMRLNKLESGMFSSSNKKSYYKLMDTL